MWPDVVLGVSVSLIAGVILKVKLRKMAGNLKKNSFGVIHRA